MPKLRGPYKRYLYDENVSIPERTRQAYFWPPNITDRKKKKKRKV